VGLASEGVVNGQPFIAEALCIDTPKSMVIKSADPKKFSFHLSLSLTKILSSF